MSVPEVVTGEKAPVYATNTDLLHALLEGIREVAATGVIPSSQTGTNGPPSPPLLPADKSKAGQMHLVANSDRSIIRLYIWGGDPQGSVWEWLPIKPQMGVESGTAAPVSTGFLGQIYIKTDTDKVYVNVDGGTTWAILN